MALSFVYCTDPKFFLILRREDRAYRMSVTLSSPFLLSPPLSHTCISSVSPPSLPDSLTIAADSLTPCRHPRPEVTAVRIKSSPRSSRLARMLVHILHNPTLSSSTPAAAAVDWSSSSLLRGQIQIWSNLVAVALSRSSSSSSWVGRCCRGLPHEQRTRCSRRCPVPFYGPMRSSDSLCGPPRAI